MYIQVNIYKIAWVAFSLESRTDLNILARKWKEFRSFCVRVNKRRVHIGRLYNFHSYAVHRRDACFTSRNINLKCIFWHDTVVVINARARNIIVLFFFLVRSEYLCHFCRTAALLYIFQRGYKFKCLTVEDSINIGKIRKKK